MDRMEIRLAGSGGQGLILGTRTMFRALSLEGMQAAQSSSYEPTSRGGFCRSDLVVSDGTPDYPLVTGINYLIALDQVGADRSKGFIARDAVVVYDSRLVTAPPEEGNRRIGLPLTDRAIAAGSARVANIVALGAMIGITGLCKRESLMEAIRLDTPKKFAAVNLAAAEEGFRLADEVLAPAE
ncbi:MAG: pyruvate ferredoxin oxidoreductase [Hyphomicrobiales bacterium]|nr:MAG: pyruvate ferredoxin oxidoreductase [Hyphomicrobiales bacterium]